MMDPQRTEWWNDLMDGIYGKRQGGARIIIDAESAATGVGKTGLAIFLAKALSKVFDYEIEEADITLSGDEYLSRWRDHPGADQPSVIILDELAGAGAGDARRAMSTENVNLGRSWQLMRKKRVVTITTLPHWSDADSRMRRFADYRLHCLTEPIGYFRPYKVGATFDDGDVTTSGYDDVQRIRFPNMDDHNDDLYQYATKLKDELLQSEVFNASELTDSDDDAADPDEARRQQKIKDAQRARDKGDSTRKVADIVGMSQSWVNRYTEKVPQTDADSQADD